MGYQRHHVGHALTGRDRIDEDSARWIDDQQMRAAFGGDSDAIGGKKGEAMRSGVFPQIDRSFYRGLSNVDDRQTGSRLRAIAVVGDDCGATIGRDRDLVR